MMQDAERAQARGMEIERLDVQLGQMTKLALDAEVELAEARGAVANLTSQARDLGEALDAAAAEVTTARAELREQTERGDRLADALRKAEHERDEFERCLLEIDLLVDPDHEHETWIAPVQALLERVRAAETVVEPHTQGEVRCRRCSHRWRAVRPTWVFKLECPSCGFCGDVLIDEQERSADRLAQLRGLELAVSEFLEAWDLGTSDVSERVHGAVRVLRTLGVRR